MSFSDWTGFMSMFFWLGAQFPQVLENARRQSVEGLALPFLANWLLGDMTNLIGCILTHQLPFQRWLATYFCFIDIVLLSQYVYYRKTATPPERAPSRYRTLSAAAANVATTAAVLASQRNEPPTSTYVHTRWSRRSLDGLLDSDPRRPSREDDDDVDDDALAILADSIHSERSGRHRHVSWNKESHPPASSHSRTGSRQGMMSSPIPASLQITSTIDDFDPLARGRSLQRAILPPVGQEERDWHHSEEESQRRRSSRASRRGATMIFMGAWALFGIGTLGMHGYSVKSRSALQPGRVLSSSSPASSGILFSSPTPDSPSLATIDSLVFDTSHSEPVSNSKDGQPEAGPSLDYVIGRISAWTCTTLYLTSRLPQIWKNFVRKSVEGLSMYLFVSAFLGNFFYVLSILSSPNMRGPLAESSAYLTESMPYLLGSGGTLMFDVTIVTQSFIYRPRPPARGRRTSLQEATAAEEESLMRADDVEEVYTPRRRLPVTAEERDVRN
ncbi:PQ loop repeat-domain-containing protein [Multifurca ochricompacta]|uniref:PQ loop repeat-domain-containing protein n=1 Tax=Multifurca ochricompacta TaxID=376703 RepID=A0AAD4QS14_9AGAM|nr:PQ loop repeat-domain-containing protein [Multifurca ochricompacta]